MPRSIHGRMTLLSVGATVALASCLSGNRAEAQWGWGFYNFHYTPQETTFLNQRSLALTNKAHGPTQNNVYANNPNSYVNHLHDEGYLDRYDVATRRSIESSVARYSEDGPISRPAPVAAAPRPAPAQPAAQPSPDIPLSSFFDRYSKLVWPGSAPTFGDLAEKKQASDQASLAVLNEYNMRGLASLSNVTEARAKLLEYGKPALQYVRENSTPRLADSFHLFLLSLYESLAQAATKPKAPAPVAAPN